MRTRRTNDKRKAKHDDNETVDIMNDTPLWHKYYQEMRKRVKFPRYYKHALNW